MGFNRSRKKIHKNKFNRKKRYGSIKARIVFYSKRALVLAIIPLISLAFIFIHDCITQSGYFRIKTLDIEGNHVLSKEEIIKESGIIPGQNIFAVNISNVRRKILANPWTAEVGVNREIPSGISIKIKEHKCVAFLDLGKKFLMNEQGEIFKEKSSSDAWGVPLIRGLSFSDLNLSGIKKTAPFDAVMAVLKLGESPESILPNSMIKLIQVDREIGLTIVAFEENRIIKLGYGNYQGKYEMLKTLHNYVDNKLNFQNYETTYLDNTLNRVVVRPAKVMPADGENGNVDKKSESPGNQVKIGGILWFAA